jgi:5-hydroxyisourate hydrolase-like protein (transthyretin family)
VAALVAVLLAAAFAGEKQHSNLSFVVLKDYNGKPIRNASVVLHPVNEEGKQERGGVQLKTDNEGRTRYDAVPYGKLRIQVIARGFQTHGDDYEINLPQQEIVIKLKRPQEQHSIYK